MKALFFDTETNGIKTWDNPNFKLRCVQLGAILQDTETKRVLGEVNLIIDQSGEHIPEQASKVHGITDDLASTAGLSKEDVDKVLASMIAKADIIVAHNINYDLDVLADDLPASSKASEGKERYCTMQNSIYIVKAPLTDRQKQYFTSKGKMPDHPYKVPNLTEAHLHFFGVPFEGAHDAMADIRACRDVYFALTDGA